MGLQISTARFVQCIKCFGSLGFLLLGSWGACSSSDKKINDAILPIVQTFDFEAMEADVDLAFLTKAPHVFGSPRQAEVAAYIKKRLENRGVIAISESFTSEVPNPAATEAAGPIRATMERKGENIYAISQLVKDPKCVVLLASHYDTKDIPGIAYLGANDSGSSTVALLQQFDYFRRLMPKAKERLTCEIVGVFFDGEEAILPNWNDGLKHPAGLQDNTYGSRYAASRLTSCEYAGKPAKCLPADLGGLPVIALVLMDMIGSPQLNLTRDSNSSEKLADIAAKGAEALAAPNVYGQKTASVEDDHLPFVKAGIPSLDLIDFNNLTYWHKDGDDQINVSLESIDLATKIALYTALFVAHSPQVLISDAD